VPSTLEHVRVELGSRSYDIEIGTGNMVHLADRIGAAAKLSAAVVIADANVVESHAGACLASLEKAGITHTLLSVASGERSKAIEEATRLWDALLSCGTDRQTVVIAVGGGVIGDLAGFVAATYARGLPFFQVPTTLLADVDSSVGGKVGVNLPGAKNMVGAFWQPQGVLIDTAALATLPDREYRSGLAEVVKYGVILDAKFFAYLEDNIEAMNARDDAVLRYVIARCCRLKADVVEQDERETTGIRAALNYGHTYAHAFETLCGYGQMLHGEAVAVGMLCASRLAERLGRIEAEVTTRQARLLDSLHLPIVPPPLDTNDVLSVMRRDKKATGGQLRFILPTKMGHVELVEDVDAADALAALKSDDN